jgi:hypothetical protein
MGAGDRSGIYVAGSSRELDRATHVIKRLREFGVAVIHDWPSLIASVGEANPVSASQAIKRDWATDCLSAVTSAAAFLFLLPRGDENKGAWVELGAAITHSVPIILSDPHRQAGTSIFTAYGTALDGDDTASSLAVSIAYGADLGALFMARHCIGSYGVTR